METAPLLMADINLTERNLPTARSRKNAERGGTLICVQASLHSREDECLATNNAEAGGVVASRELLHTQVQI